MNLDPELSDTESFKEEDVRRFLNTSERESESEAYRLVYTGTTVEDLHKKLEESNTQIEDWGDRRLWFTPRLHKHPKSAVYYAEQALTGGQGRDFADAQTPAMVKWKIPETEICLNGSPEVPESKQVAYLPNSEEYWAQNIPKNWMIGYIEPDEGPRIKEEWELDPKGWCFQSYNGNSI